MSSSTRASDRQPVTPDGTALISNSAIPVSSLTRGQRRPRRSPRARAFTHLGHGHGETKK